MMSGERASNLDKPFIKKINNWMDALLLHPEDVDTSKYKALLSFRKDVADVVASKTSKHKEAKNFLTLITLIYGEYPPEDPQAAKEKLREFKTKTDLSGLVSDNDKIRMHAIMQLLLNLQTDGTWPQIYKLFSSIIKTSPNNKLSEAITKHFFKPLEKVMTSIDAREKHVQPIDTTSLDSELKSILVSIRFYLPNWERIVELNTPLAKVTIEQWKEAIHFFQLLSKAFNEYKNPQLFKLFKPLIEGFKTYLGLPNYYSYNAVTYKLKKQLKIAEDREQVFKQLKEDLGDHRASTIIQAYEKHAPLSQMLTLQYKNDRWNEIYNEELTPFSHPNSTSPSPQDKRIATKIADKKAHYQYLNDEFQKLLTKHQIPKLIKIESGATIRDNMIAKFGESIKNEMANCILTARYGGGTIIPGLNVDEKTGKEIRIADLAAEIYRTIVDPNLTPNQRLEKFERLAAIAEKKSKSSGIFYRRTEDTKKFYTFFHEKFKSLTEKLEILAARSPEQAITNDKEMDDFLQESKIYKKR